MTGTLINTSALRTSLCTHKRPALRSQVTPLGDIDLNEIFPWAVEVRQAQVDVRQLRIGEQALEAGDVSQVVPRRSVP